MTDPAMSTIDGEPVLTIEGMALLVGVSEQEMRDEINRQQAITGDTSRFSMPKAWKRRGKEINARLGVTSVEEALTILRAERDGGAA